MTARELKLTKHERAESQIERHEGPLPLAVVQAAFGFIQEWTIQGEVVFSGETILEAPAWQPLE